MGSRRERALALAVVVIALVLAIVSAPEDRALPDPRASSFLASARGAKALYLLLAELEVPVSRGLAEWSAAGPDGAALALLAPTIPPTGDELDALVDWIEAGGTLLYAARPGDPTLGALGLAGLARLPADTPADTVRAGRATGRTHRWTDGVTTVTGFHRAFRDTADVLRGAGVDVLLRADNGAVVAATWRRGEGRVVAWSDAAPLRNGALRGSGAALVFARAAAEATPGDAPLVFDEYHHGFRGGGSAVAGTLRFLRTAGAGHASLQLLAVVLGLLLAAGVRFGEPVLPEPARRRSPLEHVDALAEVYRQANARGTARRLLLAQLARRLGRRAPTEPVPDEGGIDTLVTGLRAGRENIDALRAEWRRGDEGDLVALSGAMDRLVNEVKRT